MNFLCFYPQSDTFFFIFATLINNRRFPALLSENNSCKIHLCFEKEEMNEGRRGEEGGKEGGGTDGGGKKRKKRKERKKRWREEG